MDKYAILEEKLKKLNNQIDLALNNVDEDTKKYLEKFQLNISNNIKQARERKLQPSEGNLLGTLRAISEFDNLSAIDSLYNAAYDVDVYYSEECKTF